MIYLNKIGILNKKWRFTLPAIVGSIIFPLLFFSSLASAQGSSGSIDVHYKIYPECVGDLKQYIRDAIEEKSNTQQGKIQISPDFHTNASLFPKTTTDEEFFSFIKNEKKAKFALSIKPGPKNRVQFILRDLDKNMSYPWDVSVNMDDEQKGRDRLLYVAERIRAVIRGEPYKFVFICFTCDGGNKNIISLSRRLPENLKDSLKTKFREMNLDKQYIAEHKDLDAKQCKDFQEGYIEYYFRECDCIIMGQIVTEGSLVNISLKYSRWGGKSESLEGVSGNQREGFADKLSQKIIEQLHIIMK